MRVLELSNPPSVEALIERFGCRRLPFVLDSSQSNDGLGEWSFFGADPFEVVSHSHDGALAADQDGLSLLRAKCAPYSFKRERAEIPFVGGAVGFLAYDFGRQIEVLPNVSVDDRAVPDLWFALYDGIAALNHQTGVLHLIALGIRGDEAAVLDELREIVSRPPMLKSTPSSLAIHSEWQWNMTQAEFESKVSQVREYIGSGDVYQVNLSRRARCRFEGDSLALFQGLRNGNPSPYGAYVNTGELQVISTSPEQFLRKRGRAVETRPIKGTRPRGEDAAEDTRNAEALRSSEKERAELLMIVDLERNDLGRVAEFGSVKVEGLYHLEHYKRVMHQTAQVKAQLAEPHDVFDCIRSLFPGGSITGAPKVRAMEIVEELEPTRRGVYCGSIGYIGFDGDAELNIAIRSLHVTNGALDYQVGGGIVWDSDPASEYQETLDKGRAIRETLDNLCQRL